MKVKPETRTWVQAVYLGDDLRKQWRSERSESRHKDWGHCCRRHVGTWFCWDSMRHVQNASETSLPEGRRGQHPSTGPHTSLAEDFPGVLTPCTSRLDRACAWAQWAPAVSVKALSDSRNACRWWWTWNVVRGFNVSFYLLSTAAVLKSEGTVMQGT